MENLPEQALEWHRAGHGAALATVIETWGSAPRPVGSQMAVAGDGRMMGSVSGGCVEGAVIEAALTAIEGGKPQILTFGVSDENAFALGLACGGTIRILVLPVGDQGLPPDLLSGIVAARAARRPIAHRINLTDWTQDLAGPEDQKDRFRSDVSGITGQEFIHIHNPPLRMAVIGAVHIAQALLPMAKACGYDVSLIDPREIFGTDHRFPGQEICRDWPDEALNAYGLDARTAVITLTHDAKLDDPAIIAALQSKAFYVGSLGSKGSHQKRIARLQLAGLTDQQIAKIHAPIGLAIGARGPAEIAISIMAEVTRVRRQGA